MGKRLVFGVGVNDYNFTKDYQTKDCPYYARWYQMLRRCYSKELINKRISYSTCTLDKSWEVFTNFKKWMEDKDYINCDLDKDILIAGNKHYSPDTCIFVHQKVNQFVKDRSNDRGEYLLGVCWHKHHEKYHAKVSNPFTGKREHLGYFLTEIEAHLAWKKRKHELACELAESPYVTDERVAEALRKRYL